MQFKDQEVLWKAMKEGLDGMKAGEWVGPEGLVEFRWEDLEAHCGPAEEQVKVEAVG